jgi:hypothetical protein
MYVRYEFLLLILANFKLTVHGCVNLTHVHVYVDISSLLRPPLVASPKYVSILLKHQIFTDCLQEISSGFEYCYDNLMKEKYVITVGHGIR